MLTKTMKLMMLPAAAAVLVACGGGGGGTPSILGTSTPTLSGTVAVGSAVSSGAVTVYDATGTKVGEGTTSTDGKFSIQLTSTGTGPYLIKVAAGEINLHALHTEAASGTVNVTPLSDAAVSMLSPTGEATGMLTSLQTGGTAPTAAQINEKRDVLLTSLGGMLTASNATTDHFSKEFSADGTGHDKLLDSISISTSADGVAKKANLQIALKLATDPENPTDSLKVINLTSSSTVADAKTEKDQIGTVASADLAPSDAAKLYNGLIANLNACYKDAPSVRTDGTSTVLSAACKKVFFNNDPTQYLNYGQKLGSNAQFAGLFTYPDSVEFKPVDKAYLVQDLTGAKRGDGVGRAIVAMSWVNESGNRENIMLYATKYKLDGEDLLGLSGDRNQLGWSVNSHSQKREFPLKGSTAYDYVTSAYLISVRDLIKNGKSVIDYAVVTSPSGKKILMASAKGGAARDLAICKSSEVTLGADKIPTTPKLTETTTYSPATKYYCTGTSKAITFSQKFVSATETRVPSDIANANILRPLDENGQPYTPDSATVAKLPSIGVWAIEYHFRDGTTKTQKTWSVARPMTTEELVGPNGPDAVMPKYTDATLTSLKTLKTSQASNLAACASNNTYGCVAEESPIPSPTTGGFAFAWTADSKVPATSLWASGFRNADNKTFITSTDATGWDDQMNVRSTAVDAKVVCSRQTTSDTHCVTTGAANTTADYNPKTWMSYSELWGKDAEQRTMMRSYNWFQPRDANNNPFN